MSATLHKTAVLNPAAGTSVENGFGLTIGWFTSMMNCLPPGLTGAF